VLFPNNPVSSADHIPIARLKGHEVCIEYLEEQGGFTVPILVDRIDGLDLKLPPPTFSIQDVENHVGELLKFTFGIFEFYHATIC
jgi:hypothetical protein